MSRKTGGPAFPLYRGQGFKNDGMTLRDYFAAKAMPAVYADYCASARKTGWDEGWKHFIARESYEMADAMLTERERNND